MQIKFINTEDLTSEVINIKGGTLEEVLEEAKTRMPDLDILTMKQNESILKFNGYIADIIYYGVPKSEQKKGRQSKDWTDKIALFNQHYTPSSTAKILSVKTGMDVGQIYYIAKLTDTPLAKGQRGRKKR